MTEMRTTPQTGLPHFLLWALVGTGLSLGLLGAMTIGVFLLPVALLTGGLMLRRHGMTSTAWGALSGVGVIPLYVSWLNREGPGLICTSTPEMDRCVEQWSPWPWLVVGLAFVATGVILFGRMWRHAR